MGSRPPNYGYLKPNVDLAVFNMLQFTIGNMFLLIQTYWLYILL